MQLIRILFLVTAAVSVAAAVAAEPDVTVSAQGITVHAQGERLEGVLALLAREVGVDIRGRAPAGATVNADFENLPLEDALRRILGNESFALVYGPGGRLKTVRLLGTGEELVVVGGPPAFEAPTTTGDPLPGSIRPVPVSGRLAHALRAREASFQQLVELAIGSDDAAVRRDAVRVGLGVLETDPELQTSILSLLQVAQEETITRFLRRAGDERARAFLSELVRQARTPTLRARATALLAHLDTPAGG